MLYVCTPSLLLCMLVCKSVNVADHTHAEDLAFPLTLEEHLTILHACCPMLMASHATLRLGHVIFNRGRGEAGPSTPAPEAFGPPLQPSKRPITNTGRARHV